MFKRLLVLLSCLFLLLILVIGGNTLRHSSRQLAVQPAAPFPVNEQQVAQHLAQALRIKTISYESGKVSDPAAFTALHQLLERSFPLVHQHMKREVIGGHSLLYIWPGKNSQALPILLMAHQDVVPIASGTEQQWQQPPFDGVVKDGFIWGRGAWDDKGNLFSIMEACEALLAAGFQPERSVYLVFGHDEEVIGLTGAKVIADQLAARKLRFEFVLDEGLLVTEGILKGLNQPAALIGVAEKGYTSVNLSLEGSPGHSSMPPQKTTIGMMSVALSQLEQQQFPVQMDGIARQMFETIAPEMQGFNRVVLSNLWLFHPLLQRELEKSASTNAMLRTTTALTMVQAGNKDNVLPGHIDATVNFRTLPGDNQASVIEHVRRAIGNPAIQIRPLAGGSDPSTVAPQDSAAYQTLNRTIREVFANTVVAPGLMLGATDSRHFVGLSENIFKFSPVRATSEDLPRFHGTNERISVKNYTEMIRFYHQLIINSSQSVNQKEKSS